MKRLTFDGVKSQLAAMDACPAGLEAADNHPVETLQLVRLLEAGRLEDYCRAAKGSPLELYAGWLVGRLCPLPCLRGATLWGANLRWAHLWGADLRGADLRWAHLWGADLRWTDLRGAHLWGASLRGADLRGADLRGADLRGADLRWANLRGADLRKADLRWADLQKADLRWTDRRGVTCKEQLNDNP